MASVLFGCRENYVHDRPVADIGMKLFQQEPVAKELCLDEALYMLSAYKLGRSGYTNLRFDMKKRVEFPAYYRVKQHKDLITPQIDSLSEVTGVSFSLVASVQIHFKRLITLLGIALQPGSYTMVAKEGLDGSGRHAIYNQLGNVETHDNLDVGTFKCIPKSR